MTRRRERGAPSGSRRAAREFAFRALFESERGELPLEQVFMRTAAQMHEGGDDTLTPLTPEAVAFARSLAEGLDMHWEEVQDALHRTIRGWSFDQMAQTDLNILRLAAYEMMFTSEPHPPVIESAVRIARKFGGEDSGRFVNGVLGTLSRSLAEQARSQDRQPEAGAAEESAANDALAGSPAEQD
ncbi:transcription antitermination factor NusB [Deinococcus sp. Marseille-Q6407]|uniref:transcription antitermination factor NusB n=1 Tax=Deinococcus sp. Marseille-Q6407 TaxID=2969223 RepID=UPI0021C12DDD|nr:transcription antitermination factor NusB [Deinococcus sp. Marseille-Q6407]